MPEGISTTAVPWGSFLYQYLKGHRHQTICSLKQIETNLTCDKDEMVTRFFLHVFCRYYCQSEGLSKPEGLCLPGYYCSGNATVPNPAYAECPIGHYCPEGSYIPTPCPRGSFANSKRNQNVSDCKPCSPGYYCDPNATIVQERECDPGFVCILGKLVYNVLRGV